MGVSTPELQLLCGARPRLRIYSPDLDVYPRPDSKFASPFSFPFGVTLKLVGDHQSSKLRSDFFDLNFDLLVESLKFEVALDLQFVGHSE